VRRDRLVCALRLGMSFAALLLATFGLQWARSPTLYPALLVSVVTLDPLQAVGSVSTLTIDGLPIEDLDALVNRARRHPRRARHPEQPESEQRTWPRVAGHALRIDSSPTPLAPVFPQLTEVSNLQPRARVGRRLPFLRRAGEINISGNPELHSVSFAALESSRGITLTGNPALEVLEVSRLSADSPHASALHRETANVHSTNSSPDFSRMRRAGLVLSR
jgi:hypothetical protein